MTDRNFRTRTVAKAVLFGCMAVALVGCRNAPRRMNCNTKLELNGRTLDASLTQRNWGTEITVNTRQEAIRDVTDSYKHLDQQFEQKCKMYNARVLSAEEFRDYEIKYQESVERIRACEPIEDDQIYLRCLYGQLDVYRGCGQDASESPRMSLKLTARATRGGAATVTHLRNGEKLNTGDKLVFDVELSHTAHLYMVQRSQDGEIAVRFPHPDITMTNPIPACSPVRIPPAGQYYTVNAEDVGVERVFIIASISPLPALERAIINGQNVQNEIVELLDDPAACEDLSGGEGCGLTRGIEVESSADDPFFTDDTWSIGQRVEPWDDILVDTFEFYHAPAAG